MDAVAKINTLAKKAKGWKQTDRWHIAKGKYTITKSMVKGVAYYTPFCGDEMSPTDYAEHDDWLQHCKDVVARHEKGKI